MWLLENLKLPIWLTYEAHVIFLWGNTSSMWPWGILWVVGLSIWGAGVCLGVRERGEAQDGPAASLSNPGFSMEGNISLWAM